MKVKVGKEELELTEYHCPGCGAKGLWHDCDEGDYYVGEDFLCPGCGAVFTMQYSGPNQYAPDLAKLAAIRAANSAEASEKA